MFSHQKLGEEFQGAENDRVSQSGPGLATPRRGVKTGGHGPIGTFR